MLNLYPYTSDMAVRRPPAAVRRRQRTIYLPEAIDKKIRIRAAQLDTTISVVVAQALRSYFAAEREAAKSAKKKHA